MDKPKIGIVIGTTREGRFGDVPAEWLLDIASGRDDMEVEIIDLRDYPIPHYGDKSSEDESARWSEKMEEMDGYVFVTAEYNHSISGVLKNALDHLDPELHRKPATFVAYGGVGGARAVEQLRLILIELQIVPLRNAVHIGMEPLMALRKEGKSLSDFDFLNESAEATLDELAWWTTTLKAGRESVVEAKR